MKQDPSALDPRLGGLLVQAATATTKPVSVTIPAPLAEAYGILREEGLEQSLSAAVTDALTNRLQSLLWRRRLDAMYREYPGLRPPPELVDEVEAELGWGS